MFTFVLSGLLVLTGNHLSEILCVKLPKVSNQNAEQMEQPLDGPWAFGESGGYCPLIFCNSQRTPDLTDSWMTISSHAIFYSPQLCSYTLCKAESQHSSSFFSPLRTLLRSVQITACNWVSGRMYLCN
jgi:hypothetical protein